MADKIIVELSSPDFSNKNSITTKIQLLDDAGPLNSWMPMDAGAFGIDKKAIMTWDHVGRLINCRGAGVVPILILRDFDLDDPKVGQIGSAENNSDGNDFPNGAGLCCINTSK